MAKLSEQEAHNVVGPYYSQFVKIVQSAWRDWLHSAIAAQMQHKRVRASYVWNQMLSHAKEQFEEQLGIKVIKVNKNSYEGILIGKDVFIRFKKGNKNLQSSNYPTLTALAFNEPELDLFGGLNRLEVLYVLNRFETAIEQIVLTQRDGSRNLWAIDLLDYTSSTNDSPDIIMPQKSGTDGLYAKRMLNPKSAGDRSNDEKDRKFGS